MIRGRQGIGHIAAILLIVVLILAVVAIGFVLGWFNDDDMERKNVCDFAQDCSWFRTTILATAKNPILGRPRGNIDDVTVEPLSGGSGLSLPDLGFFANYKIKARYVVTIPNLDVVEGETATQTGRIGIGGERSHTLDFDIFGPSGRYTINIVLMFKEGDKPWWDDDTRTVIYVHQVAEAA